VEVPAPDLIAGDGEGRRGAQHLEDPHPMLGASGCRDGVMGYASKEQTWAARCA
jgi:hypothetical protein